MLLTSQIKASLEKSVLCWLATSSLENEPNVSPKEAFTSFGDDSIIIANIASPQTVKNIRANPKVCLSILDILVQKGFQLKGTAKVIEKDDEEFEEIEAILLEITKGKYPFSSITKIQVESQKEIIAPSYFLFPEITEAQKIEESKQQYGLNV